MGVHAVHAAERERWFTADDSTVRNRAIRHTGVRDRNPRVLRQYARIADRLELFGVHDRTDTGGLRTSGRPGASAGFALRADHLRAGAIQGHSDQTGFSSHEAGRDPARHEGLIGTAAEGLKLDDDRFVDVRFAR